MPVRYHGRDVLLEGIRTSERENAPAFGFSIMITATFGALAALDSTPVVWEVFLFATGAVLGFTLLLVIATKGFREHSTESERLEVVFVAALLNLFSVLAAVGAAALVGWLGTGWYVWLVGPLAASATYVLVNGLEYALAEEEEEDG